MAKQAHVFAADIGGTRARFRGGDATVVHELVTRDHVDMESLLATALEGLGLQGQGLTVVLAVAGPTGPGRASLTNLSWHFEAAALERRFGFKRVVFINDLEAAARAVASEPPAGARVLRKGRADAEARAALISVSTGLGTAYWSRAGGYLHVDAAEAGHIGFAPSEEWELDLLGALQKRYGGRVSWERVLSGAGLAALEAHLREGDAHTPTEVVQGAIARETVALKAVRHFSRLLGVFAGDLVLGAPAPGGVWLMGGVLKGLSPVFDAAAFLEGFETKGRLSPQLADVSVHLTDDDRLGLKGAWALGASLQV